MKKTSVLILLVSLLGQLSYAQSKYIVVDQFGYLPDAEKIAVVRDPQTGFDEDESYAPGTTYSVIEVSSQCMPS